MSNKVIDAHVHLENGPLSVEYAMKFVDAAQKAGLKTLQILDHTHRFYEFKDLYPLVCARDERQKNWFEKKQVNALADYLALIKEMKQMDLPIEVRFGLEVCYSPENDALIHQILDGHSFDFLVGSVHSIDGYLYDMDAFSKEILWEKRDATSIYKDYFSNVKKAIQNGLFTQIGHPDVIKMYQYDPGYDLTSEYMELADLAKQYGVAMEDNTGAHYRYHHPQTGLDPKFRQILQEKGVTILTASDAHYPEHVAKDFDLLPD
jgi:histidinol-phosphatase (PHP family)